VYQYHFVIFPSLKRRRTTLGYKAVSFDASSAWVEAGNDYLAVENVVAEPYLVFGEEPVWVERLVESLEGALWARSN
jgi:hypothetical protein